MKLRVLIADDEPLGRERLRQLLRAEPGIEIVAECCNGTETVHAIRRQRPDVVFLDVKMPELDGFAVLESLRVATPPAIIFVTAHEKFALRAFAAQAVDYLLKPFDQERLQTALRRARQHLGHGRPHEPVHPPLKTSARTPAPGLERLAIRSRGRISIVETGAIDWIAAADNYIEVHVGRDCHLLRMSIGTLADQLPPDQFVRISRSSLVNAERIREIRPKSHGDYLITLPDGTRLTGTRNYRHNLARFLDKSR